MKLSGWRPVTLGLVALLHSGPSLPAPSSSPDDFGEELDALVEPRLQAYAVPGAAIGIIHDGRVLHARVYGHANVQTQQPLARTTAFNVASISKPVTAWGVMRLVEGGRVGLDAPVSSYLRRWKIPASEYSSEDVTVRRLLNHTAGLSMWRVPEVAPGEKLPTLEELLTSTTDGEADVRLMHAPGTQWEYSGGGYAVLQLLIEEVAGTDFASYMRSEVLLPLGMSGSSFVWDAATMRAAATPHDATGKPFPGQRFTATAAAGLQATLDDMLGFSLASLDVRQSEGSAVLKAATVASMQLPSDVAPAYGLGYQVMDIEGLRLVGHGGQNEGWMSQMLLSPETRDGLVIMTNGTNGLRIVSEVQCAWLLWRFEKGCEGISELPITLPERALRRFAGRYRDETGATVRLNVHDGHLFWETDYGYELALRPRSAEVFDFVIGQSHVTFQLDDRGLPAAMTQHRGAEMATFEKVD